MPVNPNVDLTPRHGEQVSSVVAPVSVLYVFTGHGVHVFGVFPYVPVGQVVQWEVVCVRVPNSHC